MKIKQLYEKLYARLMIASERLSTRQLLFVLAVIIGLVAGGAACIFEWLLHEIKDGLTNWFPTNSANWLYLIYPTVGIILTSCFVRYAVKDDISEGVTKVLKSISTNSSKIKTHNCYSSIIGSATTIGFGGSVGPEAPIVLTGAAIGSNVAQALKLNYRNTTLLLSCGVAAAIAAIFKAPITGVIFVLEILMLDISMAAIVPLLISSVTATTLVFFVRGFEPLLSVDLTGIIQLSHMPMYVVLAVACGLMSYYFMSMNFKIKERFDRISQQWRKWIVGGLMLGIMIFIFPTLYGEGYGIFNVFMNGDTAPIFDNSLFYEFKDISWVVVLYMLAIMFFKVIAMAVTNAAGGVGGTFAPSLFVGAFMGVMVAYICNTWLGMDLSLAAFSLVGMAGVMAGVMNAPLTSIFLIAEISSGYQLFVPLMLVSSISFVISRYLEPDSIYTKPLRKAGQLLTHNKDQAVSIVLDIESMVETDFRPVGEHDTLGDMVVSAIPHTKRNIFPVINSEDKLLGIILFDELRVDMFDSTKYPNSVSRYMRPPADVVQRNESAKSVLDKFEATKVWNLPMVDKDGKYLGFVSKSHILTAYREKLKEMTHDI